MIAALGTLPFIATLWLLVVLGAAILEESGAKIAAALKGVPPQPQRSLRRSPRRVRVHWRCSASGGEQQWRAAA
jgi:hypothetical protein